MKTTPLIVCLALMLLSPLAVAQDQAVDPFEGFTHAWRDHPVWYDGQAECAVYDAVKTIYGVEHGYTARAFTNKEIASPKTFTKSDDNTGRRVFKHHVRDDIPTESYTYHFSTMSYVGTEDLKSLKLDMGSQEDCGVTFKQYINHTGKLRWRQHSYFPNEGERSGEIAPKQHFAFQDALTLILRGYPFDAPPKTLELQLLRSQRDVHLTLPDELGSGEDSGAVPGAASGVAIVEYRGEETLKLPIGAVKSHHLVLWIAPDWQEHYWFASDPDRLHVLAQYQGKGISYRLKQLERCAYWR